MASSEGTEGLDGLVTESRRAQTDYSSRSTRELVELMNREDRSVPDAVAPQMPAISAAIDAIVERLAAGGRLVYTGAGSSGRIAALDAEECEGTFSTAPGQVIALVAGDGLDSSEEREAAEDDADAGRRAVDQLSLTRHDVVVAVSASGRTPYALAALRAAAEAGALTVALVAVEGSELGAAAEHELAVVVGPEFVAGSTRLKAGTAQKLVLNTISTVSMIRLGKTYGDLMVDVRSSNDKLAARAQRIVRLATGVSDDEAAEALAAADGSAKVAVVALLGKLDAEAARDRLARAGGDIGSALSS
ncbi:MAG TPA: N-acetylmuramic acid 6-phosphate etherase [Gaiellaceae bacterium]